MPVHHGRVALRYPPQRADRQAEPALGHRLAPVDVHAVWNEPHAALRRCLEPRLRRPPRAVEIALFQRRKRLQVRRVAGKAEQRQPLHRSWIRHQLRRPCLRLLGAEQLAAAVLLPTPMPVVGRKRPHTLEALVHTNHRPHHLILLSCRATERPMTGATRSMPRTPHHTAPPRVCARRSIQGTILLPRFSALSCLPEGAAIAARDRLDLLSCCLPYHPHRLSGMVRSNSEIVGHTTVDCSSATDRPAGHPE